MTSSMAPRTYLFVPADRPDRVEKALASEADAVIVDLEDAVASERKPEARKTVAHLPEASPKPIFIRCHTVNSEAFVEDLPCLKAAASAVTAIMPAKCESARDIETLTGALPGMRILPLIETVAGVAAMSEIAQFDFVERVAFGSVDLANDLGVDWSQTGEERHYAMGRIVFESRLHGLAPPVDAVFLALDNPSAFEADIRLGKQIGFFGKMIIHPSQIDPVHQVYRVTKEEEAWARKVVAAYENSDGLGAVRVEGQLVDRPVYERALRILKESSFA